MIWTLSLKITDGYNQRKQSLSKFRILLLVFTASLLFSSNRVFSQEIIDLISKDNKILEIRIKSKEKKTSDTFKIRKEDSDIDILGSWSENKALRNSCFIYYVLE